MKLLLCSVRRCLKLVAGLFFSAASALHAGLWTATAWTGDGTTEIDPAGGTVWARHFGNSAMAGINGLGVTGIASANPSYTSPEFDLSGPISVFAGDTNALTALGGSGSARMAQDFIYGGNPISLTVKGLATGSTYTVSFFSVGFDPVATRNVTFSSAGESLLLDQNQFGDNNGIRVDYTFAATAATRTLTVTPQGVGTFHLYGLALRTESSVTTVRNVANSGTGSLRWAIGYAATLPGPDTITFDRALSGQTIVLTEKEILIYSSTTVQDVTVDAGSLPRGITLTGGSHSYGTVSTAGTLRPFQILSSHRLALRRVTLRDCGGYGASSVAAGGAVRSEGTFEAVDCTFIDNSADRTAGAVSISSGTASFERCAFVGNRTRGDSGTGGASGALVSNGNTTLKNCTFARNRTFSGATGLSAGAISTSGTGSLTMEHCTVAHNTAGGTANAAKTAVFSSTTATFTNCLIAGNPGGTDVHEDTGTLFAAGNITLAGANLIQTVSGGALAGPARLTADPELDDVADRGGPTPTVALYRDSPAIDAAVASTATTDQRGLPRGRDGSASVAGSASDLGAWEAQTAPVPGFAFYFKGGHNGDPNSPGGQLPSTDVAGVPAFRQAFWNGLQTDWDGGDDGTAPNAETRFNTAGQNIASLRLWWDATNVWSIYSDAIFIDYANPDYRMMNGYLDSDGTGDGSTATNLYTSASAEPFFSIADLPSELTRGGYKVLVYADTGNSNGVLASYWLAGNERRDPFHVAGEAVLTPRVFLNDTEDFSGIYLRATGTDLASATPGANYVRFDGRTETGFTVRVEEHDFRAAVNAVQIVPNDIIVVTTAADELDPIGTLGAGVSLREAVRDSADGGGIVFASSLNGATITLTHPTGAMLVDRSVTIDASGLSAGLTISGNDATTIFVVTRGAFASLVGLTLTKGYEDYDGGAIVNGGTLSLVRCTLNDNHTGYYGLLGGGAVVAYDGPLWMNRCTLTDNSSHTGSAISIASVGGTAEVNLTHCTIAGNYEGHAIFRGPESGPLRLNNSIVAGNERDNIFGTYSGANNVTSGDPRLAPLADYGGPTRTMALRPGSPARNAATGSATLADQRGSAIVDVPDIGAYESGSLAGAGETVVLAETLPGSGPPDRVTPAGDFDGDGASNHDEMTAGTTLTSSSSVLRPTVSRNGGAIVISFPTVSGRSYQLWRSNGLAAQGWTNTGQSPVAGDGSVKSFTVGTPDAGFKARYYRIVVTTP